MAIRSRQLAINSEKSASSPTRKIGIAGIAEEIEVEAFAVAGSADSLEHRLQVTDDAERRLIANAKQDRR